VQQLGIEFACELLHALILREAGEVQLLDAAVARGEKVRSLAVVSA
jgi:hypothetical protein